MGIMRRRTIVLEVYSVINSKWYDQVDKVLDLFQNFMVILDVETAIYEYWVDYAEYATPDVQMESSLEVRFRD